MFLDYNIFIIIAGELDKYQYKGGEDYYIRSEDIAFQGTTSEYPRKWERRLKKYLQRAPPSPARIYPWHSQILAVEVATVLLETISFGGGGCIFLNGYPH